MSPKSSLPSPLPAESLFAHLLAVEILDFRALPMEAQAALMESLQKAANNTPTYRRELSRGNLACQMQENGLTLAFFEDLSAPLRCGLELGEALRSLPGLKTRMGIHSGPVFRQTGSGPLDKIDGEGVIVARQVMQCGDAGHILLSKFVAERIGERSLSTQHWQIDRLGDYLQPSGVPIALFNLHLGKVGNAAVPSKMRGAKTEEVVVHILYMDVVGSSLMTMEKQTAVYKEMTELVRNTEEYRLSQSREQLISRPSGDGMALIFLGDMLSPIRCACQIAQALHKNPLFQLRIGIHSGPVHRVRDINFNDDVSAGAIILAKRIMDFGDGGHILVSEPVANVLRTLPNWASTLHPIGSCKDKHGFSIALYSLWVKEVGNRATPKKLMEQAAKMEDPYMASPASPALSASLRADRRRTATLLPELVGIFVGLLVLGVFGGVLWNLKNDRRPAPPIKQPRPTESDTTPPVKTPSPPRARIIDFSDPPRKIHAGETVELKWQARDAEKVVLEPDYITFDATDRHYQLQPNDTQTYTLRPIAKGGVEGKARSFTITVVPADACIAEITDFTAPKTVYIGDKVRLRWKTKFARSGRIYMNDQAVAEPTKLDSGSTEINAPITGPVVFRLVVADSLGKEAPKKEIQLDPKPRPIVTPEPPPVEGNTPTITSNSPPPAGEENGKSPQQRPTGEKVE